MPRLPSNRHEAVALLMAGGKNKTDAYTEVYTNNGMADDGETEAENLVHRASQLVANNPKIQARVEEIQHEIYLRTLAKFDDKAQTIKDGLHYIALKGCANGDLKSAVRAYELLGKYQGMEVQRSEHKSFSVHTIMNLPNFHVPEAVIDTTPILDASEPPPLPEPDLAPITNYLEAVDRAEHPQSDPFTDPPILPGQVSPPLTAPAVLPGHIGYVPAQPPKTVVRAAPVRKTRLPKTKKEIMKQVWSESSVNPYAERPARPLPPDAVTTSQPAHVPAVPEPAPKRQPAPDPFF